MRLHISMVSRDPDEDHRASTPLELFFDLTFVVAVAQASSGLEQGLTGGRIGRVSLGYVLVFFGIWWAWMNFTWFASAYDTDDVPYRIAVLVQMTGVLILAAGVPRALAHQDFAVMVLGYVVMRLAMVALWLRAAAADRQRRRCALRYAVGITTLQCAWIAWLAVPDPARLPVFALLAAGELCVPLWAEAASRTPWHPGHIAERYGLFTIIVLGEAVLATSIVVQAALGGTTSFGDLAPDVIGGLLVVFSMWWVYFDMPAGQLVREVRRAFDDRLSGAFTWGYGHYLIFASAAAVGAGLTVAVHQVAHRTQLDQLGAALTHGRVGTPRPVQAAEPLSYDRGPGGCGAHPALEPHVPGRAAHGDRARRAGRAQRHPGASLRHGAARRPSRRGRGGFGYAESMSIRARRWRSWLIPPKSTPFCLARLKRKWASFAQVNPTPPCTWMLSPVTRTAASAA